MCATKNQQDREQLLLEVLVVEGLKVLVAGAVQMAVELLVLLPFAMVEVGRALRVHEVLVQSRLRQRRLGGVADLAHVAATLAVLRWHARKLAH